MVRYEVIRGTIEGSQGLYAPLSVTLPLRVRSASGLCIAVENPAQVNLPLISVSVGDEPPIFEGFPAVLPSNGRICMVNEFIPLESDRLGGAEFRITAITPNVSAQNIGVSLIFRYDEQCG